MISNKIQLLLAIGSMGLNAEKDLRGCSLRSLRRCVKNWLGEIHKLI